MPFYRCKCRKCAFQTVPTQDTSLAKMEMLNHLSKSHGCSFEFAHRVPMNDLREHFTIDAMRDKGEIAKFEAVKPWLRKPYWTAQRKIRIPPFSSGLSNGEFKLFLKSGLRKQRRRG